MQEKGGFARGAGPLTSGHWAEPWHTFPSCLPRAEPRACAQSRAPAVEVCVGAGGALLGTPFLAAVQCCGLLLLPLSQFHMQSCTWLPGEGETVALKVGGTGW